MAAPDPSHALPLHALRRAVLPAAQHAALTAWTMNNERAFAASAVGAGAVVDPDYRRSRTLVATVDSGSRRALTSRITALVPGILAEVGLRPLPVFSVEFSLVAYNEGDFYRRHVDIFTGTRLDSSDAAPSDRILSAIYYFHAEPKGFDGGALRLHPLAGPSPETGPVIDIEPIQNGLVAFPSWTPHEVLPVRCPSGRFRDSRFAINCWIRRPRARGDAAGVSA